MLEQTSRSTRARETRECYYVVILVRQGIPWVLVHPIVSLFFHIAVRLLFLIAIMYIIGWPTNAKRAHEKGSAQGFFSIGATCWTLLRSIGGAVVREVFVRVR